MTDAHLSSFDCSRQLFFIVRRRSKNSEDPADCFYEVSIAPAKFGEIVFFD